MYFRYLNATVGIMGNITKDEIQVFADSYLKNVGLAGAIPFENAVDRIENVTR